MFPVSSLKTPNSTWRGNENANVNPRNNAHSVIKPAALLYSLSSSFASPKTSFLLIINLSAILMWHRQFFFFFFLITPAGWLGLCPQPDQTRAKQGDSHTGPELTWNVFISGCPTSASARSEEQAWPGEELTGALGTVPTQSGTLKRGRGFCSVDKRPLWSSSGQK